MADMNPAARPQTSRNRDRALTRLSSITTGTAIAAAVATIGFGGLAAANYSGTTNAATTVSGDDTTDSPAATGSGAGVQVPTATGASGAATRLTPTSPPVAAVKKKAKVTSGGSH